MLEELQAANRMDLIPLGTLLASLAFGLENTIEQAWLIRKVNEMYDTLQETPVYKFLTKDARQEGLEKGLQEGRQEGFEKGREEALRQAVVDIVRKRFPKL